MHLEDYLLPCPNKKIFGVDCPGCGVQRATVLLVKGKPVEAFSMFPAIYTTLLFFVAIAFHFLFKKSYSHKIILGLGILNVVIMLIAYIYKMKILIN